MRRHVPHADQAPYQRDRSGELVYHEGILGRELILGGPDVRGERALDGEDLVVDLICCVAL